MKAGIQHRRDALAHGARQVAAGRCVLLGFGRSPGTQEGVRYQRGFKSGVRKTRNSQQLSLRASSFCPKSSKFFAFFKNKLPKADTTLVYVCGTTCSPPALQRTGGAKGRQLPHNPCLHHRSLAGWKRGAGMAWGQEPACGGTALSGKCR